MSILLAALVLTVEPPPANSHLEPLAFFVGSCWRGTFPDGRQTDTHCFTPMFGGAFIRDVHVVDGAPTPYSGETLYRWDVASAAIRFDYYASDGAHTAGVAVPSGDVLNFPEIRRDRAGREMRIETSWTRDGSDAYFVRSAVVEGERRREMFSMRMVRAGPAR